MCALKRSALRLWSAWLSAPNVTALRPSKTACSVKRGIYQLSSKLPSLLHSCGGGRDGSRNPLAVPGGRGRASTGVGDRTVRGDNMCVPFAASVLLTGVAEVSCRQVGLGKWKGNNAGGSTAIGGAGRQKVQEVAMRMEFCSKKRYFAVFSSSAGMDLFYPQGLISFWSPSTAQVQRRDRAAHAAPAVISDVQSMRDVCSIQEHKEFFYVIDQAASLYAGCCLQAWKAA